MTRRLFLAAACALALLVASPVYAAVGDAVTCGTNSQITTGNTLAIQPGAGAEWLIQNIYFEANIQIERYDGSNLIGTISMLGPDWQNFSPGIRVTNANYLRIKNLDAGSKRICYDGVVVK